MKQVSQSSHADTSEKTIAHGGALLKLDALAAGFEKAVLRGSGAEWSAELLSAFALKAIRLNLVVTKLPHRFHSHAFARTLHLSNSASKFTALRLSRSTKLLHVLVE